jgi:AcrR family transcriptional regulator
LVALRLFERKGFDQVTMDEIAEAAEVSRRTLFRTFPSKTELVWDGLGEVLGELKRRAVEQAETKASLPELVEGVFALTLRRFEDPAAAKVARRRLRLIGASPELLNHQTIDELQAVLTSMIAAARKPGDPPPDLMARTLVAVGFSSILWWAQQEEGASAAKAFRDSLATIARLA